MSQQKYRYYFQHEETGHITFKEYELEEIESYDGIQIPHRYFITARCQFTGLLSKDGVEIYEGDVVKWGHLPNRTECWHRVAKVEMFPSLQFNILHYIDSKTLEKKKGNKHIFGFSNFIYKDTHNSLEVIGNIYENIELTEEVK